ncbi:helix-turn-helix domain-containing protein [Flavobacterium branchiicola]|uniref:Helix-turn-helix domain-containing protein n=1 Tax=Flavobacterium branchiicola TaxID=1114875 RepID=A0ABV9P8Z0_9FLAO|nr:AraC family transcriptional regulator [Flavobacterium branchiicola]MBS7253607.1 helix-turn-helix transcriptional regulator [Flavobacterium branchiicola]
MINISHTYSLTSVWLEDLAKQLGTEVTDDKLLVVPEEIAEGGFFFSTVAPGLSVVLLDLTFKDVTFLKRLKSDNDLYIIHYDFSDEMNLIHIEGIKHKIGYKANLGLGVFDNAIENIFQPAIGERVFAMRLIVSKELLRTSIISAELEGERKRKIKTDQNTLYFYDHIDSNSKLIMHAIKNKSFLDPAFEIYLQGVSLRLLAKFINRYSNLTPMLHHISEKEVNALNQAKEYLMNNLFDVFPGVLFLADIAGMSVTKFKILFKKMFVCTPKNFFLREKMILANELLRSENFSKLSDIARELNFSKVSLFSSVYFQQYGNKPVDDFVKSEY